MKQIILTVFLLPLFFVMMDAQVTVRSSRDAAKDNSFATHLWYGGGMNVGFANDGFSSLFRIGVSPMVGYKIFEEFSIGPRLSLQYDHYRFRPFGSGGSVETTNSLYWAAGVFSRYKVLRTIFAHVEYEFENAPVYAISGNSIEVLRRERTNAHVGAGYNSGDKFGYEILLLYNLLHPENDINSPFSFRIGFTYNF